MDQIAKTIIIAGLVLVAIGLLWNFKFFNFGKLPGDFSYQNEKFKMYFPLATSIILSLLLTLIFWVIRLVTKN